MNKDRIQAAIDVLNAVRRASPEHNRLVNATGNLIAAYIELGGKPA